MSDMTAPQLTEYLKQIVALETSVYKQREAKKEANGELRMPWVDEPYIKFDWSEIPSRVTIPLFPKMFEDGFEICAYAATGLCLFGFFGVPLTLLLSLFGLSFALLGISLLCAIPFIKRIIANKKNRALYEKQYAEWKCVREKEEEAYNRLKAEADKQFEKEQRLAEKKFANAKKEVQKLDAPLLETEKLLAQLYALDIIFPKYRDIVAMCAIYEYFAAGRCTELTGPNGAYNLYEAELRQNLIIDQLERVNANLEQIKKNQFMLYQGVMETKEIMRSVAGDIREILSLTTDIANSSRITAFCSQITAENTQALKYIAMIKS